MLQEHDPIMPENLAQFFHRITGREILPYQERYGNNPFTSTVMIIPTGLGKTEAVLVPWLFAVSAERRATPRRLLYVLPRQNLTRQTAERARKLVKAAGLCDAVRVLELMGGSEDNKENIGPDEFAIIVATQDIAISRACNRGYARRPPRWPIDFALLNNDTLWVMDEVQLAAESLATSTQLAAFREEFGTFGQVPCVWMSATLNPEWLDTVDFRKLRPALGTVELDAEDLKHEVVRNRFHASKKLQAAPEECRTPEGCAEFVLHHHRPGERTLVIANTVQRARGIAAELRKRKAEPVLLHSRFRPRERETQLERLTPMPQQGQIVVATQVLEAGVDISSHRLLTDAAPWGSLVQRFGRVNRYGDEPDAEIWWVDRPLNDKPKAKDEQHFYAPYEAGDVQKALEELSKLTSATPSGLNAENGPAPWRHVLRRSDLLDLFDTSPDVSGNEIDVSRFVRAGEDKDCYIAWREWEGDGPRDDMPAVTDDELCPVPIGEAHEFSRKHRLFRWHFALEKWQPAERNRLYPGMVLVAHAREGGYTMREGWNPDSKAKVELVQAADESEEGDSSDSNSRVTFRQTLRDHTDLVVSELRRITAELPELKLTEYLPDLESAAAKHDWGKTHPVMQQTLHKLDDPPDVHHAGFEFLAKQRRGEAHARHSRQHFRHELASALAMLAAGDSDLAAYLAAAHHGRIRLTIRSMSGERHPSGRIARGVVEGEVLPACELASGVHASAVPLSLEAMGIGSDGNGCLSWTDRALKLRDSIGPFRLTFLEMLLRAADERASATKEEAAVCNA